MLFPGGNPTPVAGEPQEVFLQRLLANLIQGGGPFGAGGGGMMQGAMMQPQPLPMPQAVPALKEPQPLVAQPPAPMPQMKQPQPQVARGPMLGRHVFQGFGQRAGPGLGWMGRQ